MSTYAQVERNVLLAWVLALLVCVLLGAGTFAAGLYIVFKQLVPQAAAICAALLLLLIGKTVRLWTRAQRAIAGAVAIAK